MEHVELFGFYIVGFLCSSCALKIHAQDRHQSLQVDSSFQGLLPIEWVHVPKAGSSFLNTLIHIPGACPGLPTDLFVSSDIFGDDLMNEKFVSTYHPLQNCNSSVLDVNDGRILHYGIELLPEGGFNAGKGHFMMFMRQPEQRYLSSYHFSLKHGRQFAFMPGLVTKMLARKGLNTNPEKDFRPPTTVEFDEAKTRLQTGFSFIGITEHWNLSICLFNRMFNQACQSMQFRNAHPTKGTTLSTWDTKEMFDYYDQFDDELYNIALKIFEVNLKKYNVSESTCETCWREAGVF